MHTLVACSVPPVPPTQLLTLIQKTLERKDHPEGENSWKCRRCLKELGVIVPIPKPPLQTPSKVEEEVKHDISTTVPPTSSTSTSSTPINISFPRQQSKNGHSCMSCLTLDHEEGGLSYQSVTANPSMTTLPSTKGKKRAKPTWDYQELAHSPTPSSTHNHNHASYPIYPSSSPKSRSGPHSRRDRDSPQAPSTPFQHMLSNDIDHKPPAPDIPLVGGKADISALVKSMRKQGKLDPDPQPQPQPVPHSTGGAGDTQEFIVTSPAPGQVGVSIPAADDVEEDQVAMKLEEDDSHELDRLRTSDGSGHPPSTTPTPAPAPNKMGPHTSPSVPPPSSGLGLDWLCDWENRKDKDRDRDKKDEKDKKKTCQALWRKYAHTLRKRHEQHPQTQSSSTARRKPQGQVKRLGPKGRMRKEEEGMQVLVKEWAARHKGCV